MTDQATYRIQSLARGLALLSEIASSVGDLTAAELSRRIGVSRQTTYHLLHTLRQAGYVEQAAGQRYRLGWSVTTLVDGYARQVAPPREALDLLTELAQRSGESCSLSAWSGNDVVLIAKEPGVHTVRVADLDIGQHGALHARAAAKTLLAHCSPERRQEVFSELTFERYTQNTITDPVTFGAEIERASIDGFATDHGELVEDMTCVASCVNMDGTDFAFTILAPSERYAIRAEDYNDAVLALADVGRRPRTATQTAVDAHGSRQAARSSRKEAVR
ncbi:IclR family transcriptional regulator [Streptomyces rhizosphaericus]|uniref:Glycerol operon regulatory protein n=1 Tax=Streptomyces rhizosphaericus TaxID=114699 RepID=A0A6G4AX92_9ACTN|nr:IclR family transcriptional regulator [Streptomyces rhizosphaericus]NEW77374.1 IclR family transcriptional regulator [Streptomyces rhizosphaericus]